MRNSLRNLRAVRMASIVLVLLSCAAPALARKKAVAQRSTLDEYLKRARATATLSSDASTSGSLWLPNGRLLTLAADYRARDVNDTIVIRVSEVSSAVTNGSVKTARSFAANSGIDQVGGQSLPELQNLFSPHSDRTLTGSGQTSSDTTLTANLSGHVVEVLPNGNLVIEAERQLTMNNQHQRMFVRGIVRPGDIAPDNSISSSAIGNLEFELEGKGVISDSVAPPNKIMRLILKLVGF